MVTASHKRVTRKRRSMAAGWMRPVTGLATIAVIIAVIAAAAVAFRGGFAQTVSVTVLSPRAGLVMNPDAKVKLRGVEVGKVASIEERPNGQAAIHLEMNPSQLRYIPANVGVDIASTTVFGAKYVQFVPPADASPQRMHAGQQLGTERVTVEFNTVFQQLNAVLSVIEPAKLNETLSVIAKAFDGRGEKIGQTLSDFDALLRNLEPSLPNLSHDVEATSAVAAAYADAAPDLIAILDAGSSFSQTLSDEQHNLDALLLSAIGLADVGNDVVGTNRQALTDTLHLLVPTTGLLNQYHHGLGCALGGLLEMSKVPPPPVPGALLSASAVLGKERYRYPADLPKVAAKGGPFCLGLPNVPFESRAPFVVADIGTNPFQYGNQGILLNSDGLKQALYGPLDGPARNTAQIGQPG